MDFIKRIATILAAIGAALSLCTGAIFAVEAPVQIVNQGFEEGNKSWELPSNYSIAENVSHTGSKSLQITNTDPEVYQLATQQLTFQPDTMYKFGVWVKTSGVVGLDTGATICIEYWDAKGTYLGGSYPSGIKGDNDWTLIEGEISAMPKGTSKVSLSCYMRKGMTGTAWFDDLTIAPYYGIPLDCALVKPAYRGTLSADARDQQVLVFARVAKDFAGGYKVGKVNLVVEIADGNKTFAKRSLRPVPGLNKISMNAGSLPVGEYKVTVKLLDLTGSNVDSRELSLIKLPAGSPKPTVYMDEYGRAIKNGKPFFPLGFYFGPNPAKDGSYKEHIDRISNSPFNTVMPYGINVYDLDTIREYLDYLDSKNVSILYSLKDILKGIAYYEDNMLGLGDEQGQINGIVTAFRNHPALLGWYLNDEAPTKYQDRLIERYKKVKALDPNHPTWSVLCDPGSLFSYLETCDVLGTDPYPMNRGPIATASNWAAATVNVADGHRGVWMVPQVMDWNCYNYDKENRAPTLDEMITMSYLCLIEGAKGMIYYSYFDLQRDTMGFDKRWNDVMVMGREIKQLVPAVMSTEKPMDLKVTLGSDSLKTRTFANDGVQYVLISNMNKTKGSAAIVAVPKGYRADLLRNSQTKNVTANIDKGKLLVKLGPYQSATVILSK